MIVKCKVVVVDVNCFLFLFYLFFIIYYFLTAIQIDSISEEEFLTGVNTSYCSTKCLLNWIYPIQTLILFERKFQA